MPAPTVQNALALPVATVDPGVSIGGADRCDNHADVSMVMMVVTMVRLRGLRSREGCETKSCSSRKNSERFGRNSHGEPRLLCV